MTETEPNPNPRVAASIPPKRRARVSWPSVLFSAVLLVAALLLSDPQHVYEELSGVDLLWLIPCFGVACVQLVLLGLRWSKVSRALGVELNVVRATIEYTLSVALNLLLPSGLAGDGFRAYRHHRLVPGPGVLRIVEALALDRVSGQLALGLVVLVGIPLGVTHEVLELSSLAIFAVAGAVLVLGGAWLSRRVRRLGEITASLARLSSRALRVLFTPRSLVWHLPLSLLFTAASVTQLFIASRALGVSMSLTELFWAGPLILLAASLPSFFGGWGVREGASGLVFAALGHAPGTGVAISVVYGVFGLIVHLPGLLVLVIDSNPAATAAPAQSEGNR